MSEDPPTVLVVDDEPDVTEVYAMWLSEEYEVLTANGGLETLDKIHAEVDVVLLDRRMPDMSGDEVLQRIRDKNLDPKVAMVSAVDPDFDIVDMPFDDYLTKPVMPEELNDVTEQLVSLGEIDVEEEAEEGHRLKQKREALEQEKTREELARSDAYDELTSRLQQIQANVEETVDSIEQRLEESDAGSEPDTEWEEVPDDED